MGKRYIPKLIPASFSYRRVIKIGFWPELGLPGWSCGLAFDVARSVVGGMGVGVTVTVQFWKYDKFLAGVG